MKLVFVLITIFAFYSIVKANVGAVQYEDSFDNSNLDTIVKKILIQKILHNIKLFEFF
jgi:hypothetical protein